MKQPSKHRGCSVKKKFMSEQEALHAIWAISTGHDVSLAYYICPYCGAYHLCKLEHLLRRGVKNNRGSLR